MTLVNGIGSSYPTDPYFMYAYSSPNFMAGYQSQIAAANAAATQGVSTGSTTSTASSGIDVSSLPKAEEEGSSAALWVSGALAAAAAVGCCAIKGKGNPVKGAGEICKAVKGWFSSEGSKEVSKAASKKSAALDKMKVVNSEKGLVYYIPGKTTTIKDAAKMHEYLSDKELKRLTGLRFKTGETTINGATLVFEHGGKKNFITFSGDKIVSIKNEAGADITKQFCDANSKLKDTIYDAAGKADPNGTDFVEKLGDVISKIRSGETKTILDKNYDLSKISYTTKIGDNTAEVYRDTISKATPKINKLTTLEKYDSNSDAVGAYIRTARENGQDIGAIIGKDFVSKNKLPEGWKIASFDLPMTDGRIIHIVDGKAQSMTVGGKLASSDTFLNYMEHNEDSVNKFIQKAIEGNKSLFGSYRLPQNAVLVAA